MDYLRQIEEDLRNIGIESKLKKKYPEVTDASERALDAMKAIREVYVSEIMKKNKSAKLPQSSDLLAPYLLVCNYAEGSSKVTVMALNGINLLLTHDLVPPGDVKNIMRVLSIQVSCNKVDVQLKLLQVVLQMANSLAQSPEASMFLTESVFCGFLTLALQLCDNGTSSNGKNGSSSNSSSGGVSLAVSSTALGTARQIIGLVMDGALALFPGAEARSNITNLSSNNSSTNHSSKHGVVEVSVDQASSKYSLTAIMLVRELCLFVQALPGDWIRNVSLPQTAALDLLSEILLGWRWLFQRVPFFKALLKDSVCPALKPLLKNLQEDFVQGAARHGVPAACALASKVAKLARCILIHFVVDAAVNATGAAAGAGDLNTEASFIVIMLTHALQPDRAGGGTGGGGGEDSGDGNGSNSVGNNNSSASTEYTFKSRWEEASSMLIQTGAGAGMFLSRLTNPNASATGAGAGSGASGMRGSVGKGISNGGGNLASVAGFYLTLAGGGGALAPYSSSSAAAAAALMVAGGGSGGQWAGAGGAGATQLPTYPALCCLDALLAFLLSDLSELLHATVPTSSESDAAAATASTASSQMNSPAAKLSASARAAAQQARQGTSLHLFETLLVNTMLGVSAFLQSAVANEANLRCVSCLLWK